jgi:hypothetical protein
MGKSPFSFLPPKTTCGSFRRASPREILREPDFLRILYCSQWARSMLFLNTFESVTAQERWQKKVMCWTLTTSTKVQWWSFLRTEDYGLKETIITYPMNERHVE